MAPKSAIKAKVNALLKARFAGGQIRVSDGYLNNIHVLVIADELKPLSDVQRQELIWETLEGGLKAGEIVTISLALGFAPDEPEAQTALEERGAA